MAISHASGASLLLAVAVAAAAGVLFVLAKPQVTCPRCHGKRMLTPKRKGGRPMRPRKCGLCKATGVWRLPAATAVHRFYWSVVGDKIRSRRREEVNAQLDTRKVPDDPRSQASAAGGVRQDGGRDRARAPRP